MAIIDEHKMKTPFLNDRDDDVFIGLKLPLILDNGYNSSTKTTIDAVKNNLQNLLLTDLGERVMQPNLGIRLRQFLFEQFTPDVEESIKTSIIDTLGYWMPFVQVDNIIVAMSEVEADNLKNTMNISVEFSLKKDPNTVESIQVNIGE